MDGISALNPAAAATAVHPEEDGGGRLRKAERERKACADFEAMLVAQMLKTMRKTVPRPGLAGSSRGGDTYEMLLDQKIAEDLANKRGGLGLQKAIQRQIRRNDFRKD